MGELILYYNPVSLINVMVWTASARYIFIFNFSLPYFIIIIIIIIIFSQILIRITYYIFTVCISVFCGKYKKQPGEGGGGEGKRRKFDEEYWRTNTMPSRQKYT